jgi:hypothetical protein
VRRIFVLVFMSWLVLPAMMADALLGNSSGGMLDGLLSLVGRITGEWDD